MNHFQIFIKREINLLRPLVLLSYGKRVQSTPLLMTCELIVILISTTLYRKEAVLIPGRIIGREMWYVAGVRACHRDVTSKRFVAAPASVAERRKFELAGWDAHDDERQTSERRHRETRRPATEQSWRNDG